MFNGLVITNWTEQELNKMLLDSHHKISAMHWTTPGAIPPGELPIAFDDGDEHKIVDARAIKKIIICRRRFA